MNTRKYVLIQILGFSQFPSVFYLFDQTNDQLSLAPALEYFYVQNSEFWGGNCFV